MSDVVIPNAKLPTNCFNCDYEKLTENCPCHIGICSASEYKDSKHPNCPLKEVPLHGDLIDRSLTLDACYEMARLWSLDLEGAFDVIGNAPTVLKANN